MELNSSLAALQPPVRKRTLSRGWRLAAAAWMASTALSASGVTIDLADKPLFATISVPGNLALALSVEWPTATTPAYPSTTAYTTGGTFLGYFDPEKCYTYTAVNTGTTASPDYSTSYFAPVAAASSHVCSSSSSNSRWSGNYLNWASMQTLDAFRWVLTGGYRSVDTTTSTILTKTYAAQDSAVMPDKSVTDSTVVGGATPFNWATASTKLRNIGTAMYITGANSFGTPVNYTGQSAAAGSANSTDTYRVYINVKVCDSTVGVETFCKQYGSNYKPEGLMQKYASQLRYSAFGYYNHSGNTTLQRDGGVMRARMKYIGPTKPVPGSSALTNSATEWDATTGVMVTSPDGTDATNTVTNASAAGWTVAVDNSGVMNYLNKFGYSAKSYKSKDPVAELYYSALRYFKNLGNVPSYTDLSGAGTSATAQAWLDGFPAITSWDDPILYSCQKNFILGIGDVNTHRDANLPGSTIRSSLEPALPSEVAADTSTDVKLATDMVGQLEGLSGSSTLGSYYGDSSSTSCAGTGSQCNSYYLAGLAYDAHVNDIRPLMQDKQTVNTYWMDVLENQVFKHKNPYWLGAKYGGFEVPSGFSPYATTNSATTLNDSSWYQNADTLTIGTNSLTYSTDTTGTDKRPDNYFPGNRPELMLAGLTNAFAKISSEADAATSTAYATVSPNITSSGATSYSASYDPKTWTGKVVASSVTYDSNGTPTVTDKWDARALLEAPAVTASTRKVITCCTSTGAALAFTAASLGAATLHSRTYYASFSNVPGVASGSQSAANYVAYLRGDKTNEAVNGGVYRTRSYRLGDIVNAKPLAVGAPSFPYYDVYNAGYSGFKVSYASRKTVVYAGANDGMLHAFDGSVGATASGSELFAYIPSFAYGDSSTAGTSGLASLGTPSFSHHYFVDGTPEQFDVNLNRTSGASSTTPDWRTLLIGGLGKGGKGYYAIDVTNPSAWTSETAVAAQVMWEFADPRLGYSYGKPSVVKTAKYGWVVVFTSGYNNSDGIGYFFLVNPRTGALLEAVATPAGSVAAPINLGQHTAFVANLSDMTADAVYAGDLAGNVWRLDLTGTPTTYATPTRIATLVNAAGAAQPVTTRPLIETEPNSSKRYVLVGTGKLLADTDIASASVQSFYAMIDGTKGSGDFYTSSSLPTGVSFPLTRSALQANTNLLTGIGSSPSSAMGWYFDLPVSSGIAQRVDVDPKSNQGIVTFAANLPNGSACSPSGTGTLYAVSFAGGKSVLQNGSGDLVGSTTPVPGIITDISIQRVDGKLRLYVGGNGADGKPVIAKVPATLITAGGIKQLNWREVMLGD